MASVRIVGQDLAKPTSEQPIRATYDLAEPTPMQLIKRPHLRYMPADALKNVIEQGN